MSKSIHVRRCHVCGEISEKEHKHVDRCEHCGKPMAPFFYFDETTTIAPSDDDLLPQVKDNEYWPIWGLTAIW